MLFHSLSFAALFVAFCLVYWSIGHRFRRILLLLGSYAFYCTWSPEFLCLLGIITLVDYLCGLRIAGAGGRGSARVFLCLSLFTNLAMLGFFKYYAFFIENIDLFLQRAGLGSAAALHLNIVLPLGISFYTLQSMGYVIDVYRGVVKPTKNLLDYAIFIAFFPKLLAGPIERAKNFLPQIESRRVFDRRKSGEYFYLVLWGLFKKVFIADSLAPIGAEFLARGATATGFEVLVGSYIFAFQVYADFSGYTDIARGLAGFLGFNLMQNFNLPYFARTPPEIWRRWHISLSSWVRDYVFFSLGGFRARKLRLMAILVLTMVTMGLWHAPTWSYVLWGAYHGLILCIYAVLKPYLTRIKAPRGCAFLFTFLSIFLVFNLKAYGELVSSTPAVSQVFQYFGNLFFNFRFTQQGWYWLVQLLFYTSILICLEIVQFRRNDLLVVLKWRSLYQLAFVLVAILLALYAMVFCRIPYVGGSRGFVYFQF